MTLKNNRAPLLCCFQLCAWFHCHMWIQVRVRKRLSLVLTSVTLTFDLWPWTFAWTSLLTMVITPENFMMIRWWEHGEKGVTERQTDGRTDRWTDGLNQSYSCLVAAKNKKFEAKPFHKPMLTYHQMDPYTRNFSSMCQPPWWWQYLHWGQPRTSHSPLSALNKQLIFTAIRYLCTE